VPAGDGSAIVPMVTFANVVVVVATVVVVLSVVVVVGVPLPEKSRAPEPTTRMATMATMTERRIVLRRLFARCSISNF